jgi:hypothetical protein
MEDPTPFLDHAAPILAGSPDLNDDQRADLHDIFYDSKDHNELARHLQASVAPDSVKQQLFDAKKKSMPAVEPLDKATAAITRIGQIDPKILELAEKYPNVAKILAAAASSEPKAAGAEKGKGKGSDDTKKAPAIAPDVPATPSGHALVKASDGSLHHIPSENIEKARQIDPALTVLHVEP